MKVASKIILKVLGILLLTAAVLKGWQLLTEPVANNDIWSYRPFLILTVEFELALAVWLLSGLLKKAVWLASLLSFPWNRESMKTIGRNLLTLLHRVRRFVSIGWLGLVALGVTSCVSGFNEPEKTASSYEVLYEVLEPETWVGKQLPILEHIDIAESLQKGTWLILLYHYNCPDCDTAVSMYEQMACDLAGNEDFLRIALIEVPPYGRGPVSENCPCVLGRLDETKEWFVTTPAVALLTAGEVTSVWEEKAPDLDTILQNITKNNKKLDKSRFFSSSKKKNLTHSPC